MDYSTIARVADSFCIPYYKCMAELDDLKSALRRVQEKVRDAERQLERVSSEMQTFSREIEEIEDALQRIDGDLS